MENQHKILYKPPLPFRGNKAIWRKEFINEISKLNTPEINNESTLFIDVFGGSGLLSYWIRNILDKVKIIYNDFDDYNIRLNNLDKTEEIRLKLIEIINNDFDKTKPITEEKTQLIKDLFNEIKDDDNNYLDILTLSSWLNFSGRRWQNINDALKEKRLYPRVPKTKINTEINKGYLNGIDTVKIDASDYNNFIDKLKELNIINDNIKNIYYLLDPPYLYTEITGYTVNVAHEWFDLKASIKLLYYYYHNEKFIFFTSSKSGLLETINTLSDIVNINENNIIRTINKQTRTGVGDKKQSEIMICCNI